MSEMERRYHENGKLRFECPLMDGIRNGACKEYYESGALRYTAFYRDGLLNGPREVFYENGQKISRLIFRQGRVEDGFVPVFNRYGVLLVSEYWEGGRCRGYDQNNKLCREYGLFNNNYDGIYREFYKDGRVSSERFYNIGMLEGFAKDWSEDGLRCRALFFVEGEECGCKRMSYYESGMLFREIDMIGEIPEGLETVYHENGRVLTRTVYERGMAKNGPVDYYDENGVPTYISHWKNNTCKSCSQDGTLLVKATYYRDMRNGCCIEFSGDEPRKYYYFDEEECTSKEDFLEKTFDHLAGKLANSLSEIRGYEAETFKAFYRDQYQEIMTQENASMEFFNYRELLEKPKEIGQLDWIIRLAVREFMLRLRLPIDGMTERRVVKNMLKLVGLPDKKDTGL